MNEVVQTIIKTNIKAQLENKSITPLIISGKPGIAKSKTMELIAKELEMNLLDVSAPTLTSEVLTGLPDTYSAPQYNKYCTLDEEVNGTKWSIPEMIANANQLAQDKPTILLLDDFHMIGLHLQPYFFKLLLQRSIGNFKLDSNVVILGTMNDSEQAGFNSINSAVRNRLSILQVEFDFDYWYSTFGKFLDYRVASFLKTHSKYIQEDESVDIEGYATARAWTAIAEEITYHTNDFIVKNSFKLATMQVSKAAGIAFQKHINYINAINFEEVVSKRKLVNVAQLDPLDAILYAYIVNFIATIEDGSYLLELLDYNIGDDSFIGFLIGELSNKYVHQNKLSDGLQYVIDTVISKSINKEDYSDKYVKMSKDKWDKITDYKLKNTDKLLTTASKYLI